MAMVKSIEHSVTELVQANVLLDAQKVLDAFGHVSVRHPDQPDHFIMACSRAPRFVTAEDMIIYSIKTGNPIEADTRPLYSERFIHAALYQRRADVHAICHHHSPAIMPFCIAGLKIEPVYQHGALIGPDVPIWDSRDEFADTNMLVTNMEQADSLARTLGNASAVLMRRHGVTQIASDLNELIFASITLCRNAEYQFNATLLSAAHQKVDLTSQSLSDSRNKLSEGEIKLAAHIPSTAISRALDYWRND
jgi:ribulose-5-phosphate 4-epimerase/fuculose-1-phosphate aldolase